MNLSYGQYASYLGCPQKFIWQKTEKFSPVPFHSKYAVFGMVVQRVIEDFYNEKLYLLGKDCREALLQRVPLYLAKVCIENPVNWESEDERLEYIEKSKDGVLKYLKMILDNKILGEYSVSELSLSAKISRTQIISGTLDILVKRHGVVVIADGKGTILGRDGIDGTQLFYYGLIYYLRYGKLPDVLVFLLYMSNDYFEVKTSLEELSDLQLKIVEVFNRILEKDFTATPSWDSCNFCKFKTVCLEFSSFKRLESAKKNGFESSDDKLYLSLD